MDENSCEVVDPRIRRTRLLLQQALEKLLETKEFEKISVQDIRGQVIAELESDAVALALRLADHLAPDYAAHMH